MKSKTDVPEFLLSSQRFGIHLGLSRMKSLMRRLGNPQDELKCIHVAGTNGKGSVTSYIASILAADDRRVGIYTSPFLERFSERIRVFSGRQSLDRFILDDSEGEISSGDLSALSSEVESAVHSMLEDNEEHPTEFELVTAVAFLYFHRKKCDYVVLETGLGGRLDSTNIIKTPIYSVITALGFDHTDILGKTMMEIAAEKAGIIKKDCPVFLYSPYEADLSDKDADAVILTITGTCREQNAKLTVVSSSGLALCDSNIDGQSFSVPFLKDVLHINLIGEYQLLNATLAVRSIMEIASSAAIADGLRKTRWKGRMEVLCRNPFILLDGGHNPQGVRSFRSSVDALFAEEFRKTPPRLILGFMEDKDYEQILDILFNHLPFDLCEIICVTVNNPRSLKAEKLKLFIENHFNLEALFYKNQTTMYNRQSSISANDLAEDACAKAVADSSADGAPILCLGSLYLAGQVRSVFKMHNRVEPTCLMRKNICEENNNGLA